MSGQDPITAHLEDDFIKDVLADLNRRDRKEFEASLPSKKVILQKPHEVFNGLFVSAV